MGTIEPKYREILTPTISRERNMFAVERFTSGLVHVYVDLSVRRRRDMVPTGVQISKNKAPYNTHSPLEKSPIERTMQCIKYRTESFSDCFPRRKKGCRL